jgi:hypothetical protein
VVGAEDKTLDGRSGPHLGLAQVRYRSVSGTDRSRPLGGLEGGTFVRSRAESEGLQGKVVESGFLDLLDLSEGGREGLRKDFLNRPRVRRSSSLHSFPSVGTSGDSRQFAQLGLHVLPLPSAKEDARWLANHLSELNGRPFWFHERVLVLQTDASKIVNRWGATLLERRAGGYLPLSGPQGIEYKEMLAIQRALWAFAPFLKDSMVEIRTDNMVVYSYFKAMRAKESPLGHLFKEIFLWAVQNNVVFVPPLWIPSKENVIPDEISRSYETGDWELSLEAFQLLNDRWGPIEVDRFASDSNHKVARFNS